MEHYDLIVIGTGPAGEKAVVKAAYFGHKVAVIEKSVLYGGAGVATGTLPSKTLKETALYLSGRSDKGLFGVDRQIKGKATLENFMYRKDYIIKTESDVVHKNLVQHEVDIYHGTASFIDKNKIHITGPIEVDLEADYIIIATGSYPFHPPHIPFDNERVHDSDTILNMKELPQSLAVLGAGVIGCEYATIFSTMGSKVFLINRGKEILPFIDQEIVEEFKSSMESDQIDLLLDKDLKEIRVPKDVQQKLEVILASGERLHVDMFLFAAGRCGTTEDLQLENVGISVTKRSTIEVNQNYQTCVPNIYAVGDVIGFPALASTGMDQGRIAVANIFGT